VLMGWLVECRERDQSRRYGDQVRAVKGWKRHAGAVLSVGVAVAGVLAWAASAASADEAVGGDAAPARHVVIVGVGGLLWSDVSPRTTPVLWRVAEQGAVGSLDVSGVRPRTCPVDGWLTLNGAARAAVPEAGSGACPAGLAVERRAGLIAGGIPVEARVPGLERVESYNAQFHWDPQWGLLGSSPGAGRCVTAAGPGAGLAVARRNGWMPGYLPDPSSLSPVVLGECPLTVVDLGALPVRGGAAARRAALGRDDAELGAIRAGMAAGTTLMVISPGDGVTPHLRAIVVDGPGYRDGVLGAASTREPGLVLLTDLTPTVRAWFGSGIPAAVVGSPLTSTGRGGSLAATIGMLIGQDAAAQVYRSTVTPFFLLVGFGYVAVFAVIWVLPWGRGEDRGRRRRAVTRAAGLWAASVPVGTLLAGLAPWAALPHPAAVLYTLAAAWAAVVAGIALAGPWRRDPLGPAGLVAAVTAGVIALDMMTGSHLVRETPFGLSALTAGRFYGLGNNAVVTYGAAGILCAAWLGGAALRAGARGRALAVIGAVTMVVVVAAAWPGFGAKVGGTIAMLPGFLVLLAAAAGVRLTARRWALVVVSGLVLVILFALINYFVAATGHSDIGHFAGQVLHGGAGPTLRRKIAANLGSLTANPFVLVIPVVVIVAGVVVARPAMLRARLLAGAYQAVPLLQPALSAIWLIGVLGWLSEDSGVTVPAAALPFLLPLAAAILSSVPSDSDQAGTGKREPAAANV
jgi:hypothetical protein